MEMIEAGIVIVVIRPDVETMGLMELAFGGVLNKSFKNELICSLCPLLFICL